MFACHQETLEQGVLQLSLEGKLNALTASEMREQIQDLSAKEGLRVLLELSGLELIDSSGVGAIVSMVKRNRTSGGELKIAGLQGQPKEIFKLLNLDKAFDLYDDKGQALAAFL